MNVGRPRCPVEVYSGVHGQPRACTGEPTHSAVIRWEKRRAWVRVYPCALHADGVPGAEPMTDRHRELLAARRADWESGLAGRGYVGPPTSSRRDGV